MHAVLTRGVTASSLFFDLLDRTVTRARLRFKVNGRAVVVGRGGDEPAIEVHVHDQEFFTRTLAEGTLGLGETYMSGAWSVESGTLEDLMILLATSRLDEAVRLDPRLALRMAALRARQLLVLGTKHNVRAHYDIGEELYAAMLDETRGYTCGYQLTPNDTLRQLQENKYDRILRKLRAKPGDTLFDVGCGYGGLMIHAAQHYGVIARGITNSVDHAAFAAKRVKELGLEGKVEVTLGDFREARGRYDKVATVGVFEHLGPHEHLEFTKTIARLLEEGGLGLLHTLGCVSRKNEHDPFIQKHIFPGSSANSLSRIARVLEKRHLGIHDAENIGPHYRPTLEHWMKNFRASRGALDPKKYDASFQRMWEFYLALGISGTYSSEGAVWQVLFARSYRTDLRGPVTRRYS